MKNTPYFLKTLKEPYVIILIGPPLVGKSTMVRKWLYTYDGKVDIISRDAILLEQHSSDNYTEAYNSVNQKAVDKLLIKSLENANQLKHNAIVDMTHMTPKRRTYNLSFFNDEYTKIAVVFPMLDWDEFVERNSKRNEEENKFIPEHVIKNMIGSYIPVNKEKEGFDKVITLD